MPRPPARRSTNPASIKKFLSKHQDARAEILRLFRDQLRDPELLGEVMVDDGLFARVLEVSAEEYGVRYQDVASKIGMSPAAVGRWAKQINLPVSVMRPLVIQKVGDLLDEHLQRQKDQKPLLKRGRVLAS